MANKIKEVWYAYNAKGKKIPPYKSSKQSKPRTLIGRLWHTYKMNWIEITALVIFLPVLMFGVMYVMIHALAAIMY